VYRATHQPDIRFVFQRETREKGKNCETCVVFLKTINGTSSLRLFRKIEKRHPDAKKIHIFCEQRGDYKSKWLKEQLKGTKIRLH